MDTNLSDMIKDDQPPVFETSNLDLPTESAPTETTIDAPVEETPQAEVIGLAPLNAWFEDNSAAFENISQVKVAIRGIDPAKTLIMAVLDGQGEVDGNPSRDLQVFKNADTQPVLAMPALSMQIFNNGFKLIYQYTDEIFIKCYGVKTGLICVFCNMINGHMIPYQVVKAKKKDTEVLVPRCSAEEVIAKLPAAADLEALQILYKQSSKAVDELNTMTSVVIWLLNKQEEVMDINHLLQIDNVIINMLA
jgi:hypothetical protein